jgi:uncharacterized protein YndB with AHSA1/START domain
MTVAARGYALRVDVQASADRVWAALTHEAKLARWCAAGARIAARQGGTLRLSVDRETEFEAHIDVWDPPRRLRLIHLPGSVVRSAPSAMVDDLIVEPRDAATVVRLLGSGFPVGSGYDGATRRHEAGWRQSLARLKVYLEKNMDTAEGTP